MENSAREEETAKQTTPSTDSTGTNDSSSQEKKAETPAPENKTEASADSSQVKEDTASKKTDNVEEKNESKPGAPPALTPRSEGSKYDLSSTANAKEWNDVITEMYVTNKDGNPIPPKGVQMWETFQVHAKFSLPNNTVNEGDTTTITLPETLRFPEWTDFEVKDAKDKVVAHAKINPTTKTITLTYTKYPSEHSDVLGELFFYAAVDHNKVKIEKDIDLDFKVGHKTKIGGKLHYQGPGKKSESILEKSAWQDGANKSLLQYALAINRKGVDLKEVNVQDRLDDDTKGIQIDQNSIRIYEVRWSWENGEWKHDNEKDVTTNHQIKMDDDKRGFQTYLGNIGTKGYYIRYQVKTNYEPVGGEVFKNKAKLSSKDKISEEVNISLVYRAAGGFAEGYVYSMNLHKEDEKTKQALAGAKFKVTRDSNKKVIGEYTTDSNGDITIPNLLKDDYTIEEIKAPEGYQLSKEKIKVTPNDFGTDKAYRKTITNKKIEKVSAQLQVKKELIGGRELKDNEFEFTLTDKQTNQTQKKKNVNGKVTFDPIEYDKEGTYEYRIVEAAGNDAHVFFDPNIIYATVKVVKDANGQLKVESITYQAVDEEGNWKNKDTFTNVYVPEKTKAQLQVKKVLTGRELKDGEFEFRLTGRDGEIETVKNTADGKVTFKEIEYTKAGTYQYTIAEVHNDLPGIYYETDHVTATVTVEDKAGKLEVTKITYAKAGKETKNPTFNNIYTPNKVSAQLEVNKVLTGRELKANEFEFELVDNSGSSPTLGQTLQTAKNTADGKVTFKPLEYTEAGTYEYLIKENNGSASGVAYDSTQISVIVTVEDKGGTLAVTKITYLKDGQEVTKPTFKNVYTPTKTSAKLEATKKLVGRKLKAGEFEFELTGAEDHVQQVKKNTTSGKVQFDTIEYTKAGTYHYTIKERNAGLEGITYDTKEIKATVKVTDDGQGKLSAAVSYENDNQVFTNVFNPKAISVPLQVTKTLTGRALQEGEFEFELRDGQKNLVQTVKNKADGTIPFSPLNFNKPGLYHYQIIEKTGTLSGVQYDKEPIKVTIRVAQDKDTGKLEVNTIYKGLDENGKPITKRTFNNKYKQQQVSTQLQVKKKLLGRDLKDQEFDFDLVDNTDFSPTAGKTLQTVKNNGKGEVNFKSLSFTKAGTYEYFIREKKGTAAGITYDRKFIAVTVEVEEKSGKLEVSKVTYLVDGEEVNNPTFVNRYKLESTTASLSVNKALTGRPLKDGEFNFELKGNDDGVSQTKSNVNGVVNFDKIQYTKAGVYRYTIVEKDNKLNGITYDKKVIHATVTVENKDAKLVAKVEYKNNDQTFNNTYTTKKVSAQLDVTKKLTGRDLKENEFEFDLQDDKGQVLQTKTNAADGKVIFEPIEYDTVGEYHYVIKEKAGQLGGVTYDKKEIKSTVKVTDDGNGQLVAQVTYDKGEKEFNNTYVAKETTAKLEANKVLTGRTLNDGEFAFDLIAPDGTVVETVKNDGDGKISFKELTFKAAGTYVYTIKEKAGSLGGVIYDTHTVKATVTVTDDGQGQLHASVAYENNDQTFNNSYSADKATATLSAKKLLEGRKLKESEFEFELKGSDDNVSQVKKNAANGDVTFDTIEYTKAGTYHYTITEKDTKLGGVAYDKKVIKATVTVIDDGNGHLVTKVVYEKDDQTFNNTYTATKTNAQLSIKKVLIGRALKAGEFEFELKGSDDKVSQVKKNAANGDVNFDAIKYTKAGTYHYTIAEKDTKLGGVAYDKKVIKVTIEVTDDGNGQLHAKVSYDNDIKTFENRYTPPKNGLPKTGTIVHTLAIFIGLMVLAGAIYLIKKKS
ncbi:Spy0128 family protein [Streptococcus constellatus]|uniref:Spy0128 family protein n=1 Tax=Streptococcus constellatus TaxID=76860 RepID=UPI0021B16FF5|nr:FctA domain-containing protein [Streptococcus constellatus]